MTRLSRSTRGLQVNLRRSLFVTLAIGVFVSCALAARRERIIESWRPVNYNIALVLDERLSKINKATVEITIQFVKDNVSLIDLDFGDLTVDSVLVDDEEARFEHFNGRLNIILLKPKSREDRALVRVSYHGVPKDGLIFSADKSGKPSAVGDNWPDRFHHWVPSLDHPSAKASVKFTVTAPERSLVVANGRLDHVETMAGGTRTWTYTETKAIPPYCMIIAAGEFALVEPEAPTVTPLSYYVPQVDKNFAMQGFAPANPSLKFFSETIAPYPYEKLALIVGATRFGGMENSSAIVFSSNLFDPRVNSDPISKVFNIRTGIVSLVAHEIAHQWFGDSVTESTWADLWLSEGFATYFAALFIQRHEGEAAFQRYMTNAAQTYLAYAKRKRTPLFDTETENLLGLLNPNNYEKGAWVLHMLRGLLGDERFFRGLRSYYANHIHATATSEHLRQALERVSGTDLKGFFRQWVYSAGHPVYRVTWNWKRAGAKNSVLNISVRQTQDGEPFLTPLTIEVVTPAGAKRTTVKPTGSETKISIPLAVKPSQVRIDPDNNILKELAVAAVAHHRPD